MPGRHLSQPDQKYLDALRLHAETWRELPLVSVLIPTFNPSLEYLREALESVAAQSYPNWEVCLVDDASTNGVPALLARQFAAKYPGKITFQIRPSNGHISVASNDCLALATGEYVALLDHDDRLLPHALSEIVRHINWHLDMGGELPEILYSDETTIHADGSPNPGAAFHKPARGLLSSTFE